MCGTSCDHYFGCGHLVYEYWSCGQKDTCEPLGTKAYTILTPESSCEGCLRENWATSETPVRLSPTFEFHCRSSGQSLTSHIGAYIEQTNNESARLRIAGGRAGEAPWHIRRILKLLGYLKVFRKRVPKNWWNYEESTKLRRRAMEKIRMSLNVRSDYEDFPADELDEEFLLNPEYNDSIQDIIELIIFHPDHPAIPTFFIQGCEEQSFVWIILDLRRPNHVGYYLALTSSAESALRNGLKLRLPALFVGTSIEQRISLRN